MRLPPPGLVGKPTFATVRWFGWKNYFLTVTLLKNIHGYIHGYLILGTWYREPFCHQMAPYQTLRAENWSTRLLVIFRVFFEFEKSGNHLNGVWNSRDVLFWKKKRPLPGSLQTVVRSGEAPPQGQSIKMKSRFWFKNDFFQKSRKSSNE